MKEEIDKILYVDMDDVLCDYTRAYSESQEACPEESYPQSKPGFFQNLEPVRGGVEAIALLQNFFEVYLLTAPSTRNPLCYTEKRLWVERYLGYPMVKRLIISPNKGLLRGDYLIDDHREGRGQEDFEGELIHFGSDFYPDWSAVSNRLLPQV